MKKSLALLLAVLMLVSAVPVYAQTASEPVTLTLEVPTYAASGTTRGGCDHVYDSDCAEYCYKCDERRETEGEHVYSSACDEQCDVCGEWTWLEADHVYDDCADEFCNLCDDWRDVEDHAFDNACDTTCNDCGAVREVADHVYDNACDERCNVCYDWREAKHSYAPATCTKAKTCKVCGATSGKKLGHTYDNACDKSCNRCKATRPVSGHSYKKVITKATLTKDGKIKNVCTECGYTSSKVTAISKVGKVTLSKTSYTYNGKAQKPSVTVKDAKGKTIASKYYTVTYASGRKNPGTYKVTIKMKGNYTGQKTLTFKVLPTKTSISKVTGAKKALTVKWVKKTTQVTGYEVQYSTSKSFKSYKSKTVSSAKTTSLTIKSLKAKTTYYVRVRTYKTVGGKKVYSGWSTIKYTKTK